MTSEAWEGRSRGWRLWVVRVAARIIGLLGFSGVQLASIPIAMAATWCDARLRGRCLPYWRRLRGDLDPLSRCGCLWRQFAGFARVLSDRGLAYARRRAFGFDHRGGEHLRAAVARGGCILLSAHLGNWELAGRLLGRLDAGVRIVLVKVENDDPVERALVDAAMGDRRPEVIDPRDPLAASLRIREAIAAGSVVCFLGDRLRPGQAAQAVPLLGRPVRLPLGPFQAAQHTAAPILTCFLMRRGRGRYRLEVSPPWRVPRGGTRRERRRLVERAVRAWARRLERQIRRYPFQWHNFYDVWAEAR